ncbi:MAG: cytochrome P450 [Novosphingobium sp.]|nr:cytochrome P450 [Novosphingobium sp.]
MSENANLLGADSDTYFEQFDVANEAREIGNAIDLDLGEAWAELHRRGEVHKGTPRALVGAPEFGAYDVERDSYTLTSYKACARALRDNRTFSSAAYLDTVVFRSMGPTIISMIGGEHRNLRAVAQPHFVQPRASDWWRPNWIEGLVNTLLDRLVPMERADLNLDLCARLPIHTIIRGLGVDGDQALRFRSNLLRSIGQRGGTPEEMMAAPGEVKRLLREVIDARRTAPKEDLISKLIAGRLEGEGGERELSDDDIVAYCQLIFLAGSATTWRQLGIALVALLRDRTNWEACLADRSLIPQAIEEAARWHGTQQLFPRTTTEDVEMGGVTIPAGSRVFVVAGAANRDPERWDRPGEYDIHREAKPHLGFGMGPHICLGMHVAKEEMVSALNGLMDRFPNLRLDPAAPEPELIGAMEQRGASHVRVLLH